MKIPGISRRRFLQWAGLAGAGLELSAGKPAQPVEAASEPAAFQDREGPIIDAGVFFGPYDKSPLDTRPETVLRDLDKAGIERALATSLMAVADYSTGVGNQHTLEVCRRHPDRLIPCATLLPSDYRSGENLGRRFLEEGFVAVAFFPGRQNWPLHLLNFRSCLEEMSEAGLTAIIDIRNAGEASQLADQFSHLRTPIILRTAGGGGYRVTAEYLAVGEKHAHIHFDTVNLVGYGSIEMLAQRLGVERLVFSSNTPFFYPLSGLYLVQYARLKDAERRAVLGGNLRRLLKLKT